MVETLREGFYQFDQFKSKKATAPRLKKFHLWSADKAEGEILARALAHGQAISDGVDLTRTLGNLPGNVCTPSYLAREAKALAKLHKELEVEILDEKDMKALGMGSLLSVSNGSAEPAKLIRFSYNGGNPKDKPHMLVGKGITFDTGGISIKPSANMDEMKYDMCGAASVFGVVKAVVGMQLPVNLVCLVAAPKTCPAAPPPSPAT